MSANDGFEQHPIHRKLKQNGLKVESEDVLLDITLKWIKDGLTDEIFDNTTSDVICHLEKYPIYNQLKSYGLNMEDEDVLLDVADTLESLGSDYSNFILVNTAANQDLTFQSWPMNLINEDIKAQGLEGKLEPLLWDLNSSHAIILYCAEVKSFWAWTNEWKRKLCKIGHYWTDIFEPIYVLTEI
jgi:hypothetical protein